MDGSLCVREARCKLSEGRQPLTNDKTALTASGELSGGASAPPDRGQGARACEARAGSVATDQPTKAARRPVGYERPAPHEGTATKEDPVRRVFGAP